jgi:parallel beta-helix repeat protein
VTGGGANYSGIFLDGLAGTYIYEVDRCVVTGNKNGIELDGSSNNLITNNMCVGNVEYGIKLVNGSNANNIIANWGVSNLHGFGMFDAVPTPAGIRNLVVDQISYLNTGAGLRIVDCVGDAIMNYIGNLNDIGMSVEGCDAVTVAGQIIDHSATYGVRVTNSNDCQFNLMTRLSGVKDIFIDEDSERIILLHSVYGTITDLGVDTYSEANHTLSPENDLDVGTVRYVKEEAMRSCSQYYLMIEARENGSLIPYNGDAGLFDLDGLGDLMPATGINPDIDINYELDGLGDIQSLA